MIKVYALTQDFHQSNQNLVETLFDKGRGYGVVVITINELTFGIPLRSQLNHRYGIILDTVFREGRTFNRGLDFTKAVLVRNTTVDLGQPFYVSEQQKLVLINKKKQIINQFNRYVVNYVNSVEKQAINTIRSPAYRFTTLVNYHEELGLP